MMTVDIGHRLKAARSKIETPTQDRRFARFGRRRRIGPIAVLIGGAMICSSLALATRNTADAQGLEAGGGLRQARERAVRKNAEQRRAGIHRFGKPAEKAAAQRAKERQRSFINVARRAERAAAQRMKEKHRR
jgi:hypothetical protein